MTDCFHDTNIPKNATLRQEYVTCGNPNCKQLHEKHGPYLYAYWKESKKLNKKYIGKSWEEWSNNCSAKAADIRLHEVKKVKFIRDQEKGGSQIAKEYAEKCRMNKVSVNWGYKKVLEDYHVRAMFRVERVMNELNKGNEIPVELLQYSLSLLVTNGVDITNEDAIKTFLSSKPSSIKVT